MYWIFNIGNKQKFSSQIALLKQFKIKKKYWQSISHADMPQSEPFSPTWDNLPSDDPQIIAWQKQGYLIKEKFFSQEQVDALLSEVANLKLQSRLDYNYTGTKIVQVHKQSAIAKIMMTDSRLIEILALLLDRKIIPFHSIYFNHGSEQAPHSDNIHMATFPKGYLIAVWVALEDIEEGSGEVVYYPSSHRLPYLYNTDYDNNSNMLWTDQSGNSKYENRIQSLLEENHLVEHKFLAKKGDILIWHANLIHGGSIVMDEDRTRKSIVFHYFAEGVLCYHEISQRLAILD